MEDEKIIDLYFARNEEAIRETDAAYGKRLYGLSRRYLNDEQDAEESVSDTYMQAWNSIPPKRPERFFGFLAAVCRHISLNRLDWNLAAKRNAELVALTQEMEQCIPDTSRERMLEDREIGRVLDAFLEMLPKDSRLIFLRRYWYADTISQIAERYAVTESKVKMQLSRTRAKLSVYLDKEGITL